MKNCLNNLWIRLGALLFVLHLLVPTFGSRIARKNAFARHCNIRVEGLVLEKFMEFDQNQTALILPIYREEFLWGDIYPTHHTIKADKCGNIWCSVHGTVQGNDCKPCQQPTCEQEVSAARERHHKETSLLWIYYDYYFRLFTAKSAN